MKHFISVLSLLLFSWPLAAMAGSTVDMPLVRGFANGQPVYYIQTEASDAGVAAGQGVHFVPKLANVLSASNSAVDDIYVVTNFTQPNILASTPSPVGPLNTNGEYSPLWQVNLVTWNAGATPKTLKSEAEVLAAQDAGYVTLAKPGIVVNCPVLFASAHNASFDDEVRLPLVEGLFNGGKVFYISTEASDAGVAAHDNSTFVAKLANALGASARAIDDIYVVTNFTQPNILPSIPTPFGPGNRDPEYSPLWEVNLITWAAGKTPYQLGSEADVLAAQAAGKITIAKPGVVVNCPVIFVPEVGILPNVKVKRIK